MAKYIDSEKLFAEIKRRLVKYDTDYTSAGSELKELLSFINSIQQEQPEVDLEEEIDKEWAKCEPMDEGMGLESANIVNEQFDSIARHFYELGLNARKKKE